MESAKAFAVRLKQAMERAGYEARPSVLEREFNTRYWGKPMTLHGVRRWLLGETMPRNDKILVLAEWLGETPQNLGFGIEGESSGASVRRGPRSGAYRDEELMNALMSLPVTQRRIVREVILTFARDAARERERERAAAKSERPQG
jgi:hypothetical protein